jgi:pectate lyase
MIASPMLKTPPITLLLLAILGSIAPSNAASKESENCVERAYAEDKTDFSNPERGWFIFRELKPQGDNVNSTPAADLLQTYYAQGYRLAKHILLIPTRSKPIPQDYLDHLQRGANLMRTHGFKVIYRFNYNWNHDLSKDDAPTEITLDHLEQLRPFFAVNQDVIFAVEMGFIGFWGEMHSSTQGHIVPKTVGLSESGKRILRKALEVVPPSRFVGVRYPQVIYRDPKEYGSFGYTTPLNDQSAFSGTEQSRLAAWYANFGAGELLYQDDPELLGKWAPETRYVPMWAHCDHFEDVSMDPQKWLEMARSFHFSALSNPKDEAGTKDIYDRWIKEDAYETFARKLGYRFRLVRAEFPKALRPGATCEVKIKMANDGFGRIVNPRGVELILRGPATYRLRLDDGRGNRLWLPAPGETKPLSFTAGLPAEMLPGEYEVLLNLPDPQPSLADRPDYCIRLANESVWEAETGLNRLLHRIRIESDAAGEAYQGTSHFERRHTESGNGAAETLPAFPGAEGFGAKAKGGRGGSVLIVDQLKDSGPGSLRAALEAEGPRTVVFRTSGTIKLKSELTIRHPWVTIAGQTAPGGGIAVKIDGKSDIAAIHIATHDVIVRHLRVRPGPATPDSVNGDALSLLENAHDVIIDHCSLSWGTDEVINGWYDARDITVQHCVISEALHESVHQKGPHGMGMLFGDKNRSITIHRNLFAHNYQRNPRINSETRGTFQMNNNVIYNWGQIASELSDEAEINLTGNFYKAGPSSRPERGAAVSGNVKIYSHGNISPIRPDPSQPEDAILKPWERIDRSAFAVAAPFSAPPLPALSAAEAYEAVLAEVGANKPNLDSVDQRILSDVRDGTGKIIRHPSEVGGWPALAPGKPPADRDNDGMPDAWEQQHGLNPDDAGDCNGTNKPGGYTHLEDYLNSID